MKEGKKKEEDFVAAVPCDGDDCENLIEYYDGKTLCEDCYNARVEEMQMK